MRESEVRRGESCAALNLVAGRGLGLGNLGDLGTGRLCDPDGAASGDGSREARPGRPGCDTQDTACEP